MELSRAEALACCSCASTSSPRLRAEPSSLHPQAAVPVPDHPHLAKGPLGSALLQLQRAPTQHCWQQQRWWLQRAVDTYLPQRVITFSSLTQSKTLPTLLPATLTTSQTRRNLQKYSKHLDVVPPRQLNPRSLSHTAPGGKPTAWQGRRGHAMVISASS